jgi:hypothetical protein
MLSRATLVARQPWGEYVRDYGDAASIAAAIQSIDLCGVGGVSSCTVQYTPGNGTYFEATVTYTECGGGICAACSLRFRITKVG